MVDFIGIGAQRCATSWLYASLHEHPEICAPEKEIHFFSRPRYEEKGIEWYKNLFSSRCSGDSIKGEFSTSYLYHEDAARRIREHFPDTKILVSLRDPVDRAISQYALHAKAGFLKPEEVSFEQFVKTEKSALEQGLYYEQLKRYFDTFPREAIHIILKENVDADPASVVKELYSFLGVDPNFVPPLLDREINTNVIPKLLWIDRFIQKISEFMYRYKLDRVVFFVKKTGVLDIMRKLNAKGKLDAPDEKTLKELKEYFREDVRKAEGLTGLPLQRTWGYE